MTEALLLRVRNKTFFDQTLNFIWSQCKKQVIFMKIISDISKQKPL